MLVFINHFQATTVSRCMMGHFARVRVQKIRAVRSIITWYRRQFVGDWFSVVIEKFKDCSSMPDCGKSIEWPDPPPALIVSYYPVCCIVEL